MPGSPLLGAAVRTIGEIETSQACITQERDQVSRPGQ